MIKNKSLKYISALKFYSVELGISTKVTGSIPRYMQTDKLYILYCAYNICQIN